jgi:hypothetical protein
MEPDSRWYILIWVAPTEPSAAAYLVYEGPYATREAAIAAARKAEHAGEDDRFVRVIASTAAPTGEAWDEAEEIE